MTIYVLSVSGGKDSVAMWGWAKRTGLSPRRAVANNTKWEANFDGARWVVYMQELSAAIGEPLTIVDAPVGFAERVLKQGTFPGKAGRRWCTPELKLEPFRVELDRIRDETGDDVEVLVGIRAEESEARAAMPEREFSEFYDCWVWRPILKWTIEDVIAEHHRNGLPLNPLYRLGSERVGCWPCIKSGKREIRMVAELDPARIAEIRELERKTGTTMFSLESSRRGGKEGHQIPTPIDEMIVWSKTSRGGKKLTMFPEPAGCARWGICDLPKPDPDEAA